MRVVASRAGRVRRSGLGFGAALLTGMLVLIIVTLIAGALFVVTPGGRDSVAATFLKAQPGSVTWNGRSRLNILLTGLAGRSGPADSLMLVSYEPQSRSLTTLAIPANLWVTIPGQGGAKIADAYGYGGPREILKTIESVTHLVIPYYFDMTDASIARWIDAFDGVRVHLDTSLPRIGGKGAIASGTRRLSGHDALTFALSTDTYDTDGTARLQRQQQLFTAVLRRMVSPVNLFRLPQLLVTLGGSIQTNFPYDQVPDLAHRLSGVGKDSVTQQVVGPLNGTASAYSNAGDAVMLPDRQRILALARDLFPDSTLPRTGSLSVLNGSGVLGEAAGLATWLRQARIPVGQVASAPSSAIAHTQVRLDPRAGTGAVRLATDAATLLQVPLVRKVMPGSASRVSVVIGLDFQDPTQQ